MSETTFEPGDDGGVLDASDSLATDDMRLDAMDTDYELPDSYSTGEGYGTTAEEEVAGEGLDRLLAQEQPDIDPTREADRPLSSYPALDDDSAGRTTGALVEDDEGAHADTTAEMVAGERGSQLSPSAEEDAVHVIADS